MGVVPEEESVSSKAWRGSPAGQALVTHHIQLERKIMPFQGSIYTNILSRTVNMSNELLRKVCRDANMWWVVFICLYVASFLKIYICFDLHVISTQVIMKVMDMNDIVKEQHRL